MRLLTLVVCHVIYSCTLSAQTSVKSVDKPPLTISDLGKWPSVENPRISNDGRYAIYTYKQDENRSLVIKQTEGLWEKWISGASTNDAVITENSQFVLVKAKDSLLIIKLAKNQVEIIAGVQSYRTPEEGVGEWLAYQLSNSEKTLVVRNLITGKEKRFSSVSEYVFNRDGNVLLLKKQQAKDNYTVELFSPHIEKSNTIWIGQRAGNFCFDVAGDQLAFIGEDLESRSLNALWYYKIEMDSAVVIANKKTEGVEEGLFIRNERLRFNKSGSKLFFYLEPPALPKPKPGYVSVDVWSYQDAKLQSQQLWEKGRAIKYLSVVNFKDGKPDKMPSVRVIKLERDGDEVTSPVDKMKADYVLMHYRLGDAQESYWNKASFISVYLVNTNDGSKKLLKDSIRFWTSFYQISPDEKFTVNYDSEQKNYFSYEIATGISRNITKGISVAFEENFDPDSYRNSYGFAAWLKGDRGIIINDQYDIWQIDPLCIKRPLCLTNRYGKNNKVICRLIYDDILSDQHDFRKPTKALISGFNVSNKDNSIGSIIIGKETSPEFVCAGPFIIYVNNDQIRAEQLKPIKTNGGGLYLLSMQNGQNPPNYFTTKNFRSFTQLTSISSPVKTHNWLTAELVNWISFDGTELQGILYKPASFDSSYKYPLLFHYYENRSQNLNAFMQMETSYGALNIPYFVSNGYLVFTPDIKFEFGKTGESVYNSVVSAAQYFAKKSWIDSSKMGIQGFSFGGYETYYLVTHTNLFSAAVAANGPSDLISFYGSMCRNGYATKWHERGQGRLGTDLWSAPNVYIQNSPIFYVDRVTTPVLMMHNKNDYYGLFQQGLEFFTALRRLGKIAWMLQYDTGDHGLNSDGEKADFTIRMKQFYDHFLKEKPAPRWMRKGIPARLKGVESGLETD